MGKKLLLDNNEDQISFSLNRDQKNCELGQHLVPYLQAVCCQMFVQYIALLAQLRGF